MKLNNLANYVCKGFESLKGLKLVKNKREVISHIMGLSKSDKLIYKLNNGWSLIVPKGKKNRTALITLKEIFIDKVYDIKIKDARVILDIGANIGIYSLYALFNNKMAKIYAFEPEEDNFNQIKDNVKINNVQGKIVPFKLAISNKSGIISFFKDPQTSRGHSMFFHKGEETKVEAIKLEDIFLKLKIDKCDILKIDIEGAEYDVLYNCPDEILKKIKCIMVEYHEGFDNRPEYTGRGIKKFLSDKEFKIYRDKFNVLVAIR